jgi:putative AlgH/UPF0301 family transcriptional regulator
MCTHLPQTIIAAAAKNTNAASKQCGTAADLPTFELKVFWGFASWNVTQLLGEIARRGWGLVVTKPTVGFEGWDEEVSNWENVVEDTVVAKESEYAQY